MVKAWKKAKAGYDTLLAERRRIAHQPLYLHRRGKFYYTGGTEQVAIAPTLKETSYAIYESEMRGSGKEKTSRLWTCRRLSSTPT